MIPSSQRIQAAYNSAKSLLLAERQQGHWIGELSTSALSTATAVSALCVVERQIGTTEHRDLIDGGVQYLLNHQNADGGWGDTDKSYSNIATSLLAVAALHLAGMAEQHKEQIVLANEYIDSQKRWCGLRRRYGIDKTFVVPILANCALAGLVPWSEVSPLPFELAVVPQDWYRFVGMPVVSYAIPALVAIGQARFHFAPTYNPVSYVLRRNARAESLRVLQKMQPASGGYLEAVPLTSFVVMSLAAIGQTQHAVVQQGVKFLTNSVLADGSWPIDTNLATWVTTLSLNALAGAGEEIAEHADLPWLLGCQHLKRHPFTGAAPGGWGWSDLSGAVPDADDTPSALLALAKLYASSDIKAGDKAVMRQAMLSGVKWLLSLQNRDGGWPTFCRGWGKLPFDRSGVDLTAHALRAVEAALLCQAITHEDLPNWKRQKQNAWNYLREQQQENGSWIPLWFGNQDHTAEVNPIYGTGRVLLAYANVAHRESAIIAEKGMTYLLNSQNADGGWGGNYRAKTADNEKSSDFSSSVEETAIAVEALSYWAKSEKIAPSWHRGVAWLCQAVENRKAQEVSPIGFYFAKLWYYEKLYPLIFTVAALGRARKWCHDNA
jgi:squalene-hopene/tetraprenyl-beta-curcumene cyclase